MRLTSRTWYLLSLLFFVAAVWFWLRGNEEVAKRNAAMKKAAPQSNALPPLKSTAVAQVTQSLPTTSGPSPVGAAGTTTTTATAAARDRFPYRLRNTDQSLDRLGLSDTAVLLDNAFI